MPDNREIFLIFVFGEFRKLKTNPIEAIVKEHWKERCRVNCPYLNDRIDHCRTNFLIGIMTELMERSFEFIVKFILTEIINY